VSNRRAVSAFRWRAGSLYCSVARTSGREDSFCLNFCVVLDNRTPSGLFSDIYSEPRSPGNLAGSTYRPYPDGHCDVHALSNVGQADGWKFCTRISQHRVAY
jgi:hypothetical protein